MRKRIRFLEIIFIRSLGLNVALMAFFVLINALLWHLSMTNKENLAQPLVFVNELLQFSTLTFVLFLFISYELGAKLVRTDAVECLSAANNELLNMYTAHFLLLLIPALVVSLDVILWCHNTLRLQNLVSEQALSHLLLAVLLYILIPSCIAVLLGIFLSKIKRAVAYTVIIFSALATSSVPLRLFSAREIGPLSLASILDWFSLSPPDADWLPDSIYGIPMESARWAKVLFWLFLLLFLIVYKNWQSARRKAKIILSVLAAAVLAAGVRFACRGNDSIIIKDNRADSLQYNLQNYYKEKILPKEEQADFTVDAYEMELKIRANLEAKVKMTISNRTSREPLTFTLHHGLKIKKVCDIKGNPLDYRRELDYLTVDTEESEFMICYSGQMGKYYANSQAVFLPGYSAYYPLPGVYHLWQGDKNRIVPAIVENKSQFSINIDCANSVFSNLDLVSENSFAGVSNQVGIFAGLLKKTKKDNIMYLESSMLNNVSDWNISEYNQYWSKLADFFHLLNNQSLEGRMLVFLPATILGFNCSSKYVDDGAIIYFGDLSPSAYTLACEAFLSTVKETSRNTFLYSEFVGRIYAGMKNSGSKTREKPDYEELLLFGKKFTDYSEEDHMKLGYSLMLWQQLVSYQEEKLGSKVFLNKVYCYLKDPDPEKNILDFVYYMGEDTDD